MADFRRDRWPRSARPPEPCCWGSLVSACTGGGGASPTPSVFTPTPRTTGAERPGGYPHPLGRLRARPPPVARPRPSVDRQAVDGQAIDRDGTPTPTRAVSSAPASTAAPVRVP